MTWSSSPAGLGSRGLCRSWPEGSALWVSLGNGVGNGHIPAVPSLLPKAARDGPEPERPAGGPCVLHYLTHQSPVLMAGWLPACPCGLDAEPRQRPSVPAHEGGGLVGLPD